MYITIYKISINVYGLKLLNYCKYIVCWFGIPWHANRLVKDELCSKIREKEALCKVKLVNHVRSAAFTNVARTRRTRSRLRSAIGFHRARSGPVMGRHGCSFDERNNRPLSLTALSKDGGLGG